MKIFIFGPSVFQKLAGNELVPSLAKNTASGSSYNYQMPDDFIFIFWSDILKLDLATATSSLVFFLSKVSYIEINEILQTVDKESLLYLYDNFFENCKN